MILKPVPDVRRWLVLGLAALLATALAPRADAARWNWSGSGVLGFKRLFGVDYREQLVKSGGIVEWSLKSTVEVSEKASVNVRLCVACHGLTVDQAYAEVQFKPQANLEAGRINVPFGDFYLRHDPTSDAFLSKPLPYAMGHMLRYQADRFNLGVVPMPYVDQGASFFGNVWIQDRLQIWYSLYGVDGFQSGTPRDFTFKDQLGDGGYSDNNRNISWGARLALAEGPLSAGGSYLRGAYDPSATYRYDVWGLDASAYVKGVQLRAEYLERRTDVLDQGIGQTLRKKGFYAQVEAPVIPRVTVVGRLDGLLREGPPLITVLDRSSGIVRWTFGVNVMPTIDYGFRVQVEHWRFTDFRDVNELHAGMVMTY